MRGPTLGIVRAHASARVGRYNRLLIFVITSTFAMQSVAPEHFPCKIQNLKFA